MDNRRLWLLFLIAIPVVMLWPSFMAWVGTQMGYDMTPRPPATQVASTRPVQPGPILTTQPGVAALEPPTPSTSPGARQLRVATSSGATVKRIGSVTAQDPTWVLGVELSSRGASVNGVTLNQFTRDPDSDTRYIFQQPYALFPDASRPLGSGVVQVTVEGEEQREIDLSRADWVPGAGSDGAAEFYVDLADEAGRQLLRVVKKFTLATREAAKDQGAGYEIFIEHRFENLAGRPMTVRHGFNGPLAPPKELDRGSDRYVLGGYYDGNRFRVRHDYLESFSAGAPAIDYTKGSNGEPHLWAGTASVYFNAILRIDPEANPAGAAAQSYAADYIGKIEGRLLDPDDSNTHDRHVVTRFETTDLNLAAGGTRTFPMRLFVGPRKRSLLNNDYFSALPLMYNETLVLTGGPCAWCTIGWLVNLLVWLLGIIHFVVRDWGIAIIVLVLIVRALLHPITKKSQINMMKMSKFGPELERIKKKYGDNKEELNRAMLQFYKEHGAAPVLGCLPMLLQMPIWIALFSALQSTFELRHAPFLRFGDVGLTWIRDLSQPDHLIRAENPFTIFFITISGLNVLPFLLAIVFFLQHKMTPKPPAMTPEQEQQQKMMQWMTLLFPVFLYGGPSGLNLYILASTTFGIIESKIIRKHIKEQEEREKAGAVVVDVEDTPRGKRAKPADGAAKSAEGPAKPQGWLARKMAEMQKRLDEIQKQAEKQKKRRT